MKVVYYYRGRTGSAGFLLPEDMALLKRLFAHGSLPPKAQLRGKRCWLYLRVNTNNPAADEIGISGQDTYLHQFAEENDMQIVGVYKDYMCGWDLRRPSLRFLAREAAEKKMDYILSCKQDRIYRGHDLRGLLQYEESHARPRRGHPVSLRTGLSKQAYIQSAYGAHQCGAPLFFSWR